MARNRVQVHKGIEPAMRLSVGLPGRTLPEDARRFDDAASRSRLFAVLWHTARGLVLFVGLSVLLDQFHPGFAWLARNGRHPGLVLVLAALLGVHVFVFTKRNVGTARRSPDAGEATLWLVCAGYALLANVTANVVIHRVLPDESLVPLFIPLLAIAALNVLTVLGASTAIGFRHGSRTGSRPPRSPA